MKNSLLKNLHLIIIIWAGYGLFNLYNESSERLETANAQIPVIQAKINRAKVKLAQVEKFKRNLQASEKRVEEVVKSIEKIQKQLPTDINDIEVQKTLTDISNSLKIVDPVPSPGNEVMNDFYFAKDYTFTAKGTYLQFAVFFENLAKADRILNVKELEMRVDSNKESRSRFQVLDFKTKIESFRYNPNYKEPGV